MISLIGGNKYLDVKFWTFPGGERSVRIVEPSEVPKFHAFTVKCAFEGSNDIIDLLLLVNAIRNVYKSARLRLLIPYFPFARQDRVMVEGEALALQVMAEIIKGCNFDEVEVWDPHSDVLESLFPPGVLKVRRQHDLWYDYLQDKQTVLVSPDAGASKKIYKLAQKTKLEVLECSKRRNVVTGEITGVVVPNELFSINDFTIVDDICDGGKTFIELAKELRNVYGKDIKITLCVTHGIFSKGLEPFREIINSIYAINDMGQY